MKRDKTMEKGIFDQKRISILVDYIEGELSESREIAVRKRLQENKALRADYYFLAGYLTDIVEETHCPSSELIAEYSSDISDVSEGLKKYIEKHVEGCDRCRATLEDLNQFNEDAKEIEKKVLSDFVAEKQISFMDILKKVGSQYVHESLIDPLFKQIRELDWEQSFSQDQVPVKGLGFGGEGDTSPREKEFMEILLRLYPVKDELEDLIRKGNRGELRKKLAEELGNDEKAEEVLEQIDKMS